MIRCSVHKRSPSQFVKKLSLTHIHRADVQGNKIQRQIRLQATQIPKDKEMSCVKRGRSLNLSLEELRYGAGMRGRADLVWFTDWLVASPPAFQEQIGCWGTWTDSTWPERVSGKNAIELVSLPPYLPGQLSDHMIWRAKHLTSCRRAEKHVKKDRKEVDVCVELLPMPGQLL